MKSLGGFGALAGNAIFAAAKKEAEAFVERVEPGGEVPALPPPSRVPRN